MTHGKSFILSRSFEQPSVAISAEMTRLTYNKSDVLQTGLEYRKILNKRNKIGVEPNTIKNHSTFRFAKRSRMNGPPKLFASRALIG